MCREIVKNALSGTKAGFKATRNLVFNQKAERSTMNRQKSRSIVEKVLSGTKAGFKAILNLVFNQKAERKKMDHQKSKSTFSATLPALILGLIVLWTGSAAVAAEKKYVTDPTTGKVVSAPEYGGRITSNGWGTQAPSDPYFGWAYIKISGVVEKLGIGNWGIDRDVWDFKSGPLPVSAMIGRLASWEMPDDKTYVFHIRQGVRWHNKAPMNGRLLTAQDVEYNFHRMLGLGKFTEAGPCPFGGSAPLTSIPFESITATDDSTVVIKLKEPHLPALRLMLVDYFIYIMPPEVIEQHGDTQDWRNLVGTGPFMLTDVVDGSSINFTKNPDYWGYDEKYPRNRLPYVDELRVLVLPDEAAIMAALRSGKLDFRRSANSVDQIESIQKTNPDIAVHSILFRSSDSFAPNVRKPPFNDIRVRRAMQMALDLESAAATYWKGWADATPQAMEAVKGYYIPFEQWPEKVKQYYKYDPERAKQLLAEAGYPNGFKTRLMYGTWASLDFAEIAVAYWAEIGVEVEIDALTGAEYHEKMMAKNYEGMASAISGTLFDPVMTVGWYHSDSVWNRPGAQWPELDTIVDAALAATTIEEQKRLIAEAGMYAMEKHWLILGPKSPTFSLTQPWLIGFNGEMEIGLAPNEFHILHAHLWIDSELKKEMGY